MSPNLKPFRNNNIANHLSRVADFCYTNRMVFDGEIWSATRGFHEKVKSEGISSILTTFNGPIPPDIKYHVFDYLTEAEWDSTAPDFMTRYLRGEREIPELENMVKVKQDFVFTPEQAQERFDKAIESNQEGIILRSPDYGYKHGRCTINQDGMWKFKQFQTIDVTIIGFEEQMKLKNGIERTTNEVGHLERTFKQENYEPAGSLGALEVQHNGEKFKVKPGKGYSADDKRHLWAMRFELLGKHCEVKFMPHGTLDKPRIGSLVRFRPDLD